MTDDEAAALVLQMPKRGRIETLARMLFWNSATTPHDPCEAERVWPFERKMWRGEARAALDEAGVPK